LGGEGVKTTTYLHPHEEVGALLEAVAIEGKFVAKPLDKSSLLGSASLGIELPVLSPHMIVAARQPFSPLCDLQLPHILCTYILIIIIIKHIIYIYIQLIN